MSDPQQFNTFSHAQSHKMLFPQSIYMSIVLFATVVASAVVLRIIYYLFLHPLSKFPGPWYASVSSLPLALLSVLGYETAWLLSLAKKYGNKRPIRITPDTILFSRPSSLKDIYWNPKLNTKGSFYTSGVLGPTNLFTTIDGDDHKALRKALTGPKVPWSTGALKTKWEHRFDYQVTLLISKLRQRAINGDIVSLCDKVAYVLSHVRLKLSFDILFLENSEFAADIMTMLTFNEPWGFVENGRDERNLLRSWRNGLAAFGFSTRFRFYRNVILKSPLGVFFLPRIGNEDGMGYLMGQADKQVTEREKELEDFGGSKDDAKDFLQHALEAKLDGQPLSPVQKRAHTTLLIMAGADTTGSALGTTLRFLLKNPEALKRAHVEILKAEEAKLLSAPILYDESYQHLPFIGACIRESLRLQPPAPMILTRLTPPEGIAIDGHWAPGGFEVLCHSAITQRDPDVYTPDPDVWRPERWLVSKEILNKYESLNFVFGMGPRVCLGKDIALMELWKLIPELIRRLDMDLIREGEHVNIGGIAYNKDLLVKLTSRD
ncbi:hypothetical protein HYFRA_00010669 [Hymenoscyphus fraxineus]|uniref:Cytochrome P450 n=1 Tax=Hymenoscyphus fraxineus TaxID=746836 RepID=A0A9N9L4J3_9HELO|nr:hypothetical protein HYFRA_00010669 [Hymenoscyphus fraxineus]